MGSSPFVFFDLRNDRIWRDDSNEQPDRATSTPLPTPDIGPGTEGQIDAAATFTLA
jgi:hypothetical protein